MEKILKASQAPKWPSDSALGSLVKVRRQTVSGCRANVYATHDNLNSIGYLEGVSEFRVEVTR